ncbi:winged helix-turn-helix transcriptional regulator [Candidatus Parcubacteria bacterium]|nr:MAG: winged helix-turn-helix transcriptional regulator [Candidatus Parcubacteria bacterium]
MRKDIQEFITTREGQTFDRKSARIEAKDLANHLVAFANADGGTIIVGIYDSKIEGTKNFASRMNDFMQMPFDFCRPPVKVNFDFIDCINNNREADKLLIIEIPQSLKVHSNHKDEVYYRIGDESRKLSFNERLQLMYDKGEIVFENTFIERANIEDINISLVEDYRNIKGSTKTPLEFLESGLKLIEKDSKGYKIKAACILLFGKEPESFFPRARVRFLKYEGTEEKTGTELNLIKDKIFTGPLKNLLDNTIEFVKTQVKDYSRLGADGKFETIKEYPDFAIEEGIVNSVIHRDYGISGTDIHIKMFSDRLEVHSPGRLPGLVRIHNMRGIHFSRNPQIASVLADYKYVKELGEGVDRMYKEMSKNGNPLPEYSENDFMIKLILRSNPDVIQLSAIQQIAGRTNRKIEQKNRTEKSNRKIEQKNRTEKNKSKKSVEESELKVLEEIRNNGNISREEISKKLSLSPSTVQRRLDSLKKKGKIIRIGPDKGGYWKIN